MQFIFKKENLFIRIAAGFFVGIIIGFVLPDFAILSKVIGDIYLHLIKMMIAPIIFCAVSCGIINMDDTESLKRIGIKTVLLYVLMFILSAIISLAISYALRPGLNLNLKEIPAFDAEISKPDISAFLLNMIPDNPIKVMAENQMLPLIIFTVIFSCAVLMCKNDAEPVIAFINGLSAVCFKMLDMIMEVSPLGVCSLIAFSVAKYGSGIFSALGMYIFTCYVACVATFLFAMALPLFLYTKMPLKRLLKGLYKIWLVTFSTTSSAAALPTSIEVSINDFKAPEGISKFTLPLGCTINMCGGACSFCALAVFVSDFYSINLSLGEIVTLVVVATLLNMAAPGIPGGGIMLGASFLSIIGLPFDLMGIIAAFYRLLDMAFTTINVTGDIVANLMIAKSEKQWDVSMIKTEN